MHVEKIQTPLENQQLDLVFKALGNQTRREILSRLMKQSAIVGDIAEPFGMSLPAIGKHLRVLEKAGLIKRKIDGRIHHCSLSATPMQQAEMWLRNYKQFWEGTLDSLSAHFDND